jgi:hypothetical protein
MRAVLQQYSNHNKGALMKISSLPTAATARFLSLLVLAAVGLGGCTKQQPRTLAAPIQAELDKFVSSLPCIPAESFPYSSQDNHNLTCNDCDAQVEAGLLTKQVDEAPPEPSGGFFRAPQANVRYELTEAGQSAYVPSSDGRTAYGASQFCFGSAHVLKIKRIFGPVMIGNMQKGVGIRFIAQIDNPNPIVYDPHMKALRVELPAAAMPGKPLIYPEMDVTAIINANNPNDLYLDRNMHVGPIGGD